MEANGQEARKPANPPDFLVKLLAMIKAEDPQLIAWSGGKVYIQDPMALEKRMSSYFRHSNFSSFQRQLNNFGFRKVEGKGKFAPCMYMHEELQGLAPESILRIRRKATATTAQAAAAAAASSARPTQPLSWQPPPGRTDGDAKRQRSDYNPTHRTTEDTTTSSRPYPAEKPPQVDDPRRGFLMSDEDILAPFRENQRLQHQLQQQQARRRDASESDLLMSFLEKETAAMPAQTLADSGTSIFDPSAIADPPSPDSESPVNVDDTSRRVQANIFGKQHHLLSSDSLRSLDPSVPPIL